MSSQGVDRIPTQLQLRKALLEERRFGSGHLIAVIARRFSFERAQHGIPRVNSAMSSSCNGCALSNKKNLKHL